MIICIDELIRKFRVYLKEVLGLREVLPLERGWDYSVKVTKHWIELWYRSPIGKDMGSRMKVLPLSCHGRVAFEKVEGAIVTAEMLGIDFNVKVNTYCSVCNLPMVVTKNGACCWECYSKCNMPDSCRFCG